MENYLNELNKLNIRIDNLHKKFGRGPLFSQGKRKEELLKLIENERNYKINQILE